MTMNLLESDKAWPPLSGKVYPNLIKVERRETTIVRSGQSALRIGIIVLAGLGWSCARPVAKVEVSRSEIKHGDLVTVSWETKNARVVLLNGEKVRRQGKRTVTPHRTTTYELVAKRGQNEARDKATVRVSVIKLTPPTLASRFNGAAAPLRDRPADPIR